MNTASKTPPPPAQPPAGPPPGPRRPIPTRPPVTPPSRPIRPGSLADDLDHADLLLRCVQVLVADLDGMDPADRMQLASSVRTARRAIGYALTPARQHLSSAAAVADGPVNFRLPPTPPVPSFDSRTPAYELATGPLYDVLPGRQS